MAEMEEVFVKLNDIIHTQQTIIHSIADRLEKLESIGSSTNNGSATIEDYESNKEYKRNVLVVDTNTETVYRVIKDYTSVDVATDHSKGFLKLVGFESQMVTFNHQPTRSELDVLPEDVVVTIYSTTDDPYTPILSSD